MAGHVPWERVMPRLADVIHAERFGPPMGVQGGMGMGGEPVHPLIFCAFLFAAHTCL